LPEAGGGTILGPAVSDVADLYGESGLSCIGIIKCSFVYGYVTCYMPSGTKNSPYYLLETFLVLALAIVQFLGSGLPVLVVHRYVINLHV